MLPSSPYQPFNLKALIKRYALTPNKGLGQHFLADQAWCDKLLAGIALNGAHVIEIGPGPGILTHALLRYNLASLTLIERDKKFITLLNDMPNPNKIAYNVINDDALKLSTKKAISQVLAPNVEEPLKYIVVGNLPYNIGSELLINWVKERQNIVSITVMLQLEVVQRIIAEHGTKDYGRLSIILQSVFDCHEMFQVPSSAFTPPPKVTSAVVRLIPKDDSSAYRSEFLVNLSKLTNAAFTKRRKMIRVSIKQFFINNWDNLLLSLNLKETMRPEEISVKQFCELAKNMQV